MLSSQAVRTAGWLAGLAAALWMTAGGSAGAAASTPGTGSPSSTGSWTVYHGSPAGRGVSTAPGTVATPAPAWASPALDGPIYGEPLVSEGRIYVATENDTVYALSPATGQVAWSRHLATPVPASSLPCGDIAPTAGITGTPVIDPARREIFVVADEEVRGRPTHVLAGLGTATGRVEMTRDVDPAGADTSALLQRTGLNLARGRVVFGFGGNDGDCATYRGRVVSVPEAGGTPAMFTVDGKPGQSQGAVWMGGAAPAVDSAGHVWVSAGNGSVYKASRGYDDSDSVLELLPSMRLLQYFAPASWPSDNSRDLDLSAEPALLPGGQVLIAGKSAIAYLLDGAHLGGIGGQLASTQPVCGANIDGGTAVTGRTVYLPCAGGIVAVRVTASPPGVRLLWNSRTGGGPPIVAGGLVWTISQAGWLYGLDPRTGHVRRQAPLNGPSGMDTNHFPTPAAGAGLLLAPAGNRVYAFRAHGSGSTPASTGPADTGPAGTAASGHTTPIVQGGGGAATGGLSGGAVAGIVAATLVVLAGLGWLVWRRVPNRP
jgi:outer membrane protein assembly factor BamB